MLTLHSSELMPGGSPRFKTKKDIDKLYVDLEEILQLAKSNFQAGTLCDYYNYYNSINIS